METHVKLGRVFGIEIGLHYSWFVIGIVGPVTSALVGASCR